MKIIYVIAGGPGFGKTTIIQSLEKKGFYCGEEFAREFIDKQVIEGGKILPWKNRLKFNKLILQKRINLYENAPLGRICFFDRGIPDIIAYFKKDNLKVPKEFYAAAKKYRYQKKVFFTPPWKEIFDKDSKRRNESFDEAVVVHNFTERVYKSLNYQIINIPKIPVNKRAEFILSKINKK